MRWAAVCLAIATIGACNMANANEPLASALEQAGYVADLEPAQAGAVREAIAKDGFGGMLDHPTRTAMVDGEDLAEGGVSDWLEREIAPLLEARGISSAPVEDRFPEDASGYSVVADGKEYWMWREGDNHHWARATSAAFEIVNDRLAAAGVDERLYLADDGVVALLLTPAQAQLVQRLGNTPRRQWPFIPADDGTEWFGQYH